MMPFMSVRGAFEIFQLTESPLYFVILGALFVLLCLGAPPLLAVRKGYTWYFWILAGGPLGLIVLAFLPYAGREDAISGRQPAVRQTGDTLGLVLSLLGMLGIW